MKSKNTALANVERNTIALLKAREPTAIAVGLLSFVSGAPLLGTVTTALRYAINLRFGTRLDEQRAKKVIDVAVSAPDKTILEVMFLLKKHPKRAQLEREMRLRLQDVADALDDAVIDPLVQVMHHQMTSKISQREAQRLVDLIRPLSESEFYELRRMLKQALSTSSDPLIGIISWNDKKDGTTPTTSVGVGADADARWVEVTDCPSTLRLFRLLRSCEWAVQRNIYGSGETIQGRPQEAISMTRENIQMILRVL